MRRKTLLGEIKSRILDLILLIFSLAAIIGGLGFMILIILGFPEFYAVPFFEFFIVFILGVVGFRQWRNEMTR